MEAKDLLEREAEFRKLNQQLEKKTASLMKEIENSMQSQDEIFNDYTPFKKNHKKTKQKNSTPTSTPIKENHKIKAQEPNKSLNKACECSFYNQGNKDEDCMAFLEGFVKNAVQEAVLPYYFLKDELSVKSICNFLSSKVKILQEQIEKQQTIIDTKAQQCDQHMRATAELETERLKLKTQLNSSGDAVIRLQSRISVLENQTKERQKQYNEVSRELERCNTQLKLATNRATVAESKMDALQNDFEKAKSKLDGCMEIEKELRTNCRELEKSNKSKMSAVLKSKSILEAKIDRLNRLIENLKRQRDSIAMLKLTTSIEKEFLSVIDLKKL